MILHRDTYTHEEHDMQLSMCLFYELRLCHIRGHVLFFALSFSGFVLFM